MIIILKLLEIFQYVFLSFFSALIISNFLNKYMILLDENNENNKINLYIKVTIYLFVLSTVYYFIHKYIPKIPFILKFLEKRTNYICSLKNENIRGTTLGIDFILFNQQNEFKKIINMIL
jgi:hypothetical protein